MMTIVMMMTLLLLWLLMIVVSYHTLWQLTIRCEIVFKKLKYSLKVVVSCVLTTGVLSAEGLNDDDDDDDDIR